MKHLLALLFAISVKFINGDHVPVCTKEPCAFITAQEHGYRFYPFDLNEKILEFKVRAGKPVALALTTYPIEQYPIIEIFVGNNDNTKTILRKDNKTSSQVEVNSPGILTSEKYRYLWIVVEDDYITIGGKDDILRWKDENPFVINYVGFRTMDSQDASWKIKDMDGSACWVAAKNGKYPDKALKGGIDIGNQPLYVARSSYFGSIIPGKCSPMSKNTFIPFGGQERIMESYEVLTKSKSSWAPYDGTDIPLGATRAGRALDGEPLYVARGKVENTTSISIGKMHHSNNLCYLPYGGKEYLFEKCEVLVSTCGVHDTKWSEDDKGL